MATQWRGQDTVKRNMAQYAADVKSASKGLADEWAIEIGNYAQDNAPWDDQSGLARMTLWSRAVWLNGKLIIFLSHGMEYGVWLELRNQGKYAIILPTLEYFYTPIQNSFKRLLS